MYESLHVATKMNVQLFYIYICCFITAEVCSWCIVILIILPMWKIIWKRHYFYFHSGQYRMPTVLVRRPSYYYGELAVFFRSGSRNHGKYSFRLSTEGWPGWVSARHGSSVLGWTVSAHHCVSKSSCWTSDRHNQQPGHTTLQTVNLRHP